MYLKKCIKCKLNLPLDNFTLDESSKDGHTYYCRPCIKASRKSPADIAKATEARKSADSQKAALAAEGLRQCTKCGEVKPYREYHHSKSIKGGYVYQCKSCAGDYVRKRNRQRKQIVTNRYGGHCFCCGESNLEFLAIHHLNGDGGEHRKTLGTKHNAIIDWLINNNFPDGFQTVCHNCHFALHLYGYCPHMNQVSH